MEFIYDKTLPYSLILMNDYLYYGMLRYYFYCYRVDKSRTLYFPLQMKMNWYLERNDEQPKQRIRVQTKQYLKPNTKGLSIITDKISKLNFQNYRAIYTDIITFLYTPVISIVDKHNTSLLLPQHLLYRYYPDDETIYQAKLWTETVIEQYYTLKDIIIKYYPAPMYIFILYLSIYIYVMLL